MLNHSIIGRVVRLVVFGLVAATVLSASAKAGSGTSHYPKAGAQNKPLSAKEVRDLIAHAETKGDHERIAQYFDSEARKYEAQAKQHADLAQLYRKTGPSSPTKYPGTMQTFYHCDDLSKSLEKAARDARQLAAGHRKMAEEAK